MCSALLRATLFSFGILRQREQHVTCVENATPSMDELSCTK